MVRSIQTLWAQEVPSRAEVLGKGPSLDRWPADPLAPGDVVVALNHAALVRPCTHVVFLDTCCADTPFPPAAEPIRQERFAHTHGGRGYTFTVNRHGWFEAIQMDRHQRGDVPEWAQIGSAAVAVWILAAWGVQELVLVGMDSMDDPEDLRMAECLRGICAPKPRGSYESINRGILRALAAHDVQPVWWHRRET